MGRILPLAILAMSAAYPAGRTPAAVSESMDARRYFSEKMEANLRENTILYVRGQYEECVQGIQAQARRHPASASLLQHCMKEAEIDRQNPERGYTYGRKESEGI
jgi:hypothetical protein